MLCCSIKAAVLEVFRSVRVHDNDGTLSPGVAQESGVRACGIGCFWWGGHLAGGGAVCALEHRVLRKFMTLRKVPGLVGLPVPSTLGINLTRTQP